MNHLQKLRVLRRIRAALDHTYVLDLADAIKENPHHLREFILIDCEIDDHGVVVLCDALAFCKQLELVDIDRNKITDVGMEAIARLVETHPTLRMIDVSGNAFTNNGVMQLARAVARSACVYYANAGMPPENAGGRVWLAIHLSFAPVYRRVVALYIPSPTPRPITKFLRKDGDNAIMHRVREFMLVWPLFYN